MQAQLNTVSGICQGEVYEFHKIQRSIQKGLCAFVQLVQWAFYATVMALGAWLWQALEGSRTGDFLGRVSVWVWVRSWRVGASTASQDYARGLVRVVRGCAQAHRRTGVRTGAQACAQAHRLKSTCVQAQGLPSCASPCVRGHSPCMSEVLARESTRKSCGR